MLNYNTELFVHHLTCLIVVANLLLSPSIHQIKPVYIYFAAQFADLGPAVVLISKNTGRKPRTSPLMYYSSLASTMWLAFGKATVTLHSVGTALLHPYRIGDWVWAFCLTFYAMYSYGGVNSAFKWLGIIKYKEERPYATVWMDKITIPMSHTWQGLAFSFTMVSTLFCYCLFTDHPIDIEEISTISFNGLIAAAVGLTNAVALRFFYQYMRSGKHDSDMYFQYGMVCAAGWIGWAAKNTISVDGPTALAAAGFSVPLFKAITRVARHLAVKDKETTVRDTSLKLDLSAMPSAAEITPPTTPDQLSAEPKYNLETKYQRNRSIDGVLQQSVDAERRASLASQASGRSISSLEDSIILVKEKAAQSLQPGPDAVNDHLRQALLNIAIYGASIGLLLYGVIDLHQTAAVAVVTSLTLQQPFISSLAKNTKAKKQVSKIEPAAMEKSCRKRTALRAIKSWIGWAVGRTMHRCIIIVLILQGIMIREVIRDPDYSSVEDLPQGWKNFRVALTSPVTWVGAAYMVALPIAGLGISNL